MNTCKHLISLLFITTSMVLACHPSKQIADPGNKIYVNDEVVKPAGNPGAAVAAEGDKNNHILQEKYGRFLNVPAEQVTNLVLYRFIDQWLHTPYKWGGTTKNGIDCSAFVQRLLSEVYNINIPRTSLDQFDADWIERFGSTRALSEGDLIFFRTMEEKIVSHVGLYLSNRMFINSSSKGVSIASLDDPYWRSRYVAAGRVKPGNLRSAANGRVN